MNTTTPVFDSPASVYTAQELQALPGSQLFWTHPVQDKAGRDLRMAVTNEVLVLHEKGSATVVRTYRLSDVLRHSQGFPTSGYGVSLSLGTQSDDLVFQKQEHMEKCLRVLSVWKGHAVVEGVLAEHKNLNAEAARRDPWSALGKTFSMRVEDAQYVAAQVRRAQIREMMLPLRWGAAPAVAIPEVPQSVLRPAIATCDENNVPHPSFDALDEHGKEKRREFEELVAECRTVFSEAIEAAQYFHEHDLDDTKKVDIARFAGDSQDTVVPHYQLWKHIDPYADRVRSMHQTSHTLNRTMQNLHIEREIYDRTQALFDLWNAALRRWEATILHFWSVHFFAGRYAKAAGYLTAGSGTVGATWGMERIHALHVARAIRDVTDEYARLCRDWAVEEFRRGPWEIQENAVMREAASGFEEIEWAYHPGSGLLKALKGVEERSMSSVTPKGVFMNRGRVVESVGGSRCIRGGSISSGFLEVYHDRIEFQTLQPLHRRAWQYSMAKTGPQEWTFELTSANDGDKDLIGGKWTLDYDQGTMEWDGGAFDRNVTAKWHLPKSFPPTVAMFVAHAEAAFHHYTSSGCEELHKLNSSDERKRMTTYDAVMDDTDISYRERERESETDEIEQQYASVPDLRPVNPVAPDLEAAENEQWEEPSGDKRALAAEQEAAAAQAAEESGHLAEGLAKQQKIKDMIAEFESLKSKLAPEMAAAFNMPPLQAVDKDLRSEPGDQLELIGMFLDSDLQIADSMVGVIRSMVQ